MVAAPLIATLLFQGTVQWGGSISPLISPSRGSSGVVVREAGNPMRKTSGNSFPILFFVLFFSVCFGMMARFA
jgi:hypothetical protein